MQHDIEAAAEAVDRQDHAPGPEDKSGQHQGPDKPDVDEGIRAIIYANTADHFSTRPRSIASTHTQNAVRERQSYGLQSDSTPVPAPEPTRTGTFNSIQRHPTASRNASPESHKTSDAWRSEYYAPRRADTFGSGAELETEDDSLGKFLVKHLRDDIFSLDVQQTSSASVGSFSKSIRFGFEGPRKKTEPRVTMSLSLAALNRMRMRRLQMKLANRIMRMHYFEEVAEDWETLLVQYITATRDNDYIRTCVDRGLHDPFLIKSERKVDAAILHAELLRIPLDKWEKHLSLQFTDGKENFNFVPPIEREPTAIGGTRTEMTRKQWTEDFLRRVMFSVVGGAFLVVPMWLMIKLSSQSASLITTTVFVFGSGIAAAYALDNPIAVVSTTAAYAAVLVVFVGTSSTPTQP
ncbi:hypothetical protein J3F83DRAFT_727126 [Trichoderma novae-zelandiae]